eukprot:TRINITY_DN6173_c0_g2_i1.p1 TRINITY_DN6173_c0_g2~~TRINITY_DN6173_c0_g2_i1.p1  ORF type:complete len:205 (+),score=64.29 TRINITY_DN6173_c0_g2_i1:265-879(+)
MFTTLERKHLELTKNLSNKAEENMSLFEGKKVLRCKVNELLGVEQKNEAMKKELNTKTEFAEELMRRLEASGIKLSEMAREVMTLREFQDASLGGTPRRSLSKNIRKPEDDPIVKDLQSQVHRLQNLLEEERELGKSYEQSTEQYELAIKQTTTKMKSILKRETEKRKQAESEVKKLTQKVEELQFMLDERQDILSWSSDEEKE